jgi:hypothetical protein
MPASSSFGLICYDSVDQLVQITSVQMCRTDICNELLLVNHVSSYQQDGSTTDGTGSSTAHSQQHAPPTADTHTAAADTAATTASSTSAEASQQQRQQQQQHAAPVLETGEAQIGASAPGEGGGKLLLRNRYSTSCETVVKPL